MQAALAAAASLGTAAAGVLSGWAAPAGWTCAAAAGLCACCGCCCGLGWGLLIGQWLPALGRGPLGKLLRGLAGAAVRVVAEAAAGQQRPVGPGLTLAYGSGAARRPAELPPQ